MTIVAYELGGVIEAESAEDLARVVLPILDGNAATKSKYRFTLNDGGAHFYVEFKDCYFEDMYYESVGGGDYVIHLSYDEYVEEIFGFFTTLKIKLDENEFRCCLEKTPIYSDGSEGETSYIESEIQGSHLRNPRLT
jgi:hypothetical protein